LDQVLAMKGIALSNDDKTQMQQALDELLVFLNDKPMGYLSHKR
tara:strand:+ start:329 stop:460 length:132 start_codon:yes stop_codon:yes gene_type:complete